MALNPLENPLQEMIQLGKKELLGIKIHSALMFKALFLYEVYEQDECTR